eukprot:COSAG01_NODE_3988_length_5458_cov_55.445792_1_plen_49_part_00
MKYIMIESAEAQQLLKSASMDKYLCGPRQTYTTERSHREGTTSRPQKE